MNQFADELSKMSDFTINVNPGEIVFIKTKQKKFCQIMLALCIY